MKKIDILGISIVAAVVVLTGCSSDSSNDATVLKSHVFSTDTEGNTITSFKRDKTSGELTTISEMNATSYPTDLVVHPNGNYIFSINSDSPGSSWDGNASVSTYKYNNSTGALTEVAGSPSLIPGTAINGAITPDGQYLYVTDQSDFEIHSFSVNSSTGVLTELDFSPLSEYEAHAIVMHPTGKFFYVGTENTQIHGHVIDANGSYSDTPNTPYSASGANNWLSITPSGEYLYTVNAIGTAINGFDINTTSGELTLLPDFPVTNSGSGLKSSAITPDGKYFYTTSKSDGAVNAYSIETNGSLSAINSYPSGGHPKSVAIDSSGTSLYTVNYDDNNVSAFDINTTSGELTPIGKYTVGTGPKRVIVVH